MKQFISPRFFILFFIIIACCKSHAQVTADFSAGYSTVNSLLVNVELGYTFHNIVAQADIMPYEDEAQPAYFGMHAGYNININDKVVIQPFANRYYELFSTDKEDAYKNKWCNGYGVKFYYTRFFVAAQYAGKDFTNANNSNYIFSFGAVAKF